MLHSFQGALPHLPLPSLDDTLKRVIKNKNLNTLFFFVASKKYSSYNN